MDVNDARNTYWLVALLVVVVAVDRAAGDVLGSDEIERGHLGWAPKPPRLPLLAIYQPSLMPSDLLEELRGRPPFLSAFVDP